MTSRSASLVSGRSGARSRSSPRASAAGWWPCGATPSIDIGTSRGRRGTGRRRPAARSRRRPRVAAGAPRRVRFHRARPATDARDRGPDRCRHAGPGEARGVAHQRGPRPADRRAGPAPGAARRARSVVPSSTRSARSRCRRPRRSTTCPTSSSPRTRPGPAGASWTAASSCSATTCGASRAASRC